jgi:hypothetical protein
LPRAPVERRARRGSGHPLHPTWGSCRASRHVACWMAGHAMAMRHALCNMMAIWFALRKTVVAKMPYYHTHAAWGVCANNTTPTASYGVARHSHIAHPLQTPPLTHYHGGHHVPTATQGHHATTAEKNDDGPRSRDHARALFPHMTLRCC